MSTITKRDAEWRTKGADRYYAAVMEEVREIKKNKPPFLVRDLLAEVQSVSHLSDSYAYDMLMAVMIEAARRGELERLGRRYRIKKKKDKETTH